ncbi:MAG TPA: DUF1552 domain-containing protein [Polyangiaceae bacterium]|nr:DUF1552 domain-containing protein [Polyangiaceae bacterium]
MKKMLSRRNVLRGAGVALALPWLESLAPRPARAQAAAAAPKRFVFIYMPGGAGIEWEDITGTGAGANWQLGSLHEPFVPMKSKMLMIRNLGNYTWRDGLTSINGGAWDATQPRDDYGTTMPTAAYILPSHSRQPSALLNCIDGDKFRQDAGQDVTTSTYNAETADQLIVRSTDPMPIPSMQLGLIDGSGAFDGRNSALSQNLSWSQAGTPLGKDSDPQKVFDNLVAGGATSAGAMSDPAAAAAAAKRQALNQSVLDSLQEQVASLQPKLAAGDRARLDDFLTGVQQLETSITQVSHPVSTAGCTVIAPPGSPTDFNVKAKAMNDLMVMALQCDVTRVVTYMMDHSRSEQDYTHVPKRSFPPGAPVVDVGGTCGNYHASQHGQPRGADFASICNWHIGNVADLVTKMDAIPEGTGTMLDNSIVLFTSDMHHGDHACWDLPVAIFGSGGGTLRQDEHIVLPESPATAIQMRDLYFTIMNQYFGMNVASFGVDNRPGMPANALISQILA